MPTTDWYLRSRRVLIPGSCRDAAIGISGETITGVFAPGNVPASATIVDVGDRLVTPGFVDCHVHINEPGRTEWEGFETATRAAAAAGITTLIDMPLNSIPVTTSVEALQAKRQSAEGTCWVDVGFWGGAVPGNAGQLAPMVAEGVFGFKAFLCHSGIDDFPNVGAADLRAAMPILAERNVPLLVHAEMETELPAVSADVRRYSTYLASRPSEWETSAIDLMIALCRQYRCPVHIVHLSSADALPAIAEAKREGLPLTVETCPHYLCLHAEGIPDGATYCKCSPPIREARNAERLWTALDEGIIDFVVSDHSPCTPELKRLDSGDFIGAWGGISSVQLGVSLVWTEARRRGYGVQDLMRWMSRGPARFAGLSGLKGRIATGFDADIVVWDPEDSFTVSADRLLHRHKLTPYDGLTLHGVVQQTYVRGERVYDAGMFAATPSGRLLRH